MTSGAKRTSHIPTTAHRQTAVDVVGAELIRACSLRSTCWLLALGVLAGLLLALPPGLDQSSPVTVTSVCINLALTGCAVVVFAVLIMTDEYTRSTLITSVAAVPNRSRLLFAKLVVASLFAATTVLIPLAVSILTLSLVRDDHLPLGSQGVIACVGVLVANVLLAVFGVYLGACVRSSTVGVVVALIAVFLVPVLSFELADTGVFLNDFGISSVAGFLVRFDSRMIGISIISLVVWIGIPAVIGTRRFVHSEV